MEKTISGVFIEKNIETIYVGEEFQLTATVYPESAYNKKLKWDSTHHLSIDQNGNIMGLVGGTGYVTVYSDDGNKTDTIKIVVESMVKGITISESNFFIDNGLNEYQLEATLIPAKSGVEPIENGITWKSSNTSVATVSSKGLIKAKKDGIVSITATSEDGEYSKSALVTVNYNGGLVIEPQSIKN